MNVSRRDVLTWTLGGLAATSLGIAPGLAAPAAATTPRFPGDPGPGRLYYGASTDQDLLAWEASMGVRLSLHRTYYQPDQITRLISQVRDDLSFRRMPLVSTKVPGSWLDVAVGLRDEWLREIAAGLRQFRRPVFLALHHEPENDAGPVGFQAHDWVAMQERAIRTFAQHAPKVTIVPIMQSWTFSPYNRSARPEAWHVPSARVFGIDNYNPYCHHNQTWLSLEEKMQRARPYAHGRPIIIGEYGCREHATDRTLATQWMRQAFRYARLNNVVAMSYFNSGRNSPDGPWTLTGGRQMVFRNRLEYDVVVRPAAL